MRKLLVKIEVTRDEWKAMLSIINKADSDVHGIPVRLTAEEHAVRRALMDNIGTVSSTTEVTIKDRTK